MAIVYPTSDLIGTGKQITATTSPIGLQSGDTLLVSQNRSIISTDTNGVDVTGEQTISVVNYGMIAGADKAIRFDFYTTNFDYTVVNGATGRVVSSDGYGLYAGSNSQSARADTRIALSNAGEITTTGQGGALFLFNSELVRLNNTGLITSTDAGSVYKSITIMNVDIARITNSGTILAASNDFTGSNQGDVAALSFYGASEDLVLHNSGLISAPVYSLSSIATVRELITNSGTLEGSVYLSDTIGGVLQNSGAIWGDVELNGGDDDYRGYGTGFVSGTVFGGVGNDTLIGSAADDRLDGGDNADILRGKRGDDTLLGGADGDRLYGDEGADRLQGDAGNDTLFGGDGDDTIVGGNGLDVLFGGAGADTFAYNSFADSIDGGAFDRIRDFTPGEDKINLSSVAAGLDFVDGAFTGTGPEVRVQVTSAGVPLVFVDYNGDAVADMRIALLGTTEPVTESDFIL